MDSNGGKGQHALQVVGLLGIAVLVAALTKLFATVIDRARLQPGDVATWVGSIGGVVAAAATVGTLVWAVRSALHESRENRQLAREVEEDKRSAEMERRRSQAKRVYASLASVSSQDDDEHPDGLGLLIGNSSDEPVYEFVLYLVWVQGAAHRTGEDAESYGRSVSLSMPTIRHVLQSLLPGQFVVTLAGPDDSPMQGQLGVEIAFTDRSGNHWVRRSSGELIEIP